MHMALYLMSIQQQKKCKDKIGDKWEGFANYWRTTQLEYTWLRSLMNRHKDFLASHRRQFR